jgi:Bacterial type II/III secretion system short domain
MNTTKCNGIPYAFVAVVLAMVSGLIWNSSLGADEPQKKSAAERRPEHTVEVIRLKHAGAQQIAATLHDLYHFQQSNSGLRLVPEHATNSIVVRASVNQIQEIRETIAKLDVEAPEAPAVRKISVFDLRSVEPDEALLKSLRVVVPESSSNELALDRARKVVIVAADPVTTDSVRALLARLETLGTSSPDEDFQVRVIWLVDTEGRRKEARERAGQTPPSDLNEVLPGLVKLGIREPRVHAQLLVNAQPNKRFEVKGIVGSSEQVSVSGRVNNRAQPPSVDITIDARLGGTELCHLQTEISAPPGHFVVLGVTPQDQTGSAFVVQMIRQEGKKSR